MKIVTAAPKTKTMNVDFNGAEITLVKTRYKNDIPLDRMKEIVREGENDAFYMADLSNIGMKIKAWRDQLPRVTPFYAVKCNDDPTILSYLARLGCSFDCASQNEIKRCLAEGASPNEIIYANPCKQPSMIKYAADHDVKLMTFDSEEELLKINDIYPGAKLVVRMLPPGECRSICWFGQKFGVPKDDIPALLIKAKSLELDVVGISFHVGSGCYDPQAFPDAIHAADWVFREAEKIGYTFNLLDVGGGFPGGDCSKISFKKVCDVLRPCLDDVFPVSRGVRLIGEPGRYVVARAYTLVVNVIGQKDVIKSENGVQRNHVMYYLNDGLYGDFNCIYFDKCNDFYVVQLKDHSDEEEVESSLWGPTCDGIDVVRETIWIPRMKTGEWLLMPDMGAYTLCAASQFNGFPRAKCHYIMNEEDWKEITGLPDKKRVIKEDPVQCIYTHNLVNGNGCFTKPALI